MTASSFNPCIVVPVYNHEHALGGVVARLRAHGVPCILVDDGSSPACAALLDQLTATGATPGTPAASAAGATPRPVLVRHAQNQGKGAAVISGVRHAATLGYSHFLQIDADGQHDSADVPRFLALAAAHPDAVIVGHPVYDASVPKARLYGRYATHVWVWINTLSLHIKDSMCGFRVYPVAPVLALANRHPIGKRMNFDTDILVRLYWDGLPMINQATRVGYPLDGVSHFKLWGDNLLITRMHTRLFFGMLWRAPMLLVRKWRTR